MGVKGSELFECLEAFFGLASQGEGDTEVVEDPGLDWGYYFGERLEESD